MCSNFLHVYEVLVTLKCYTVLAWTSQTEAKGIAHLFLHTLGLLTFATSFQVFPLPVMNDLLSPCLSQAGNFKMQYVAE